MQERKRVAGIIIRDEKLLLLKGKEYDFLWTPGGGIDGDETDEECLRRELKEELGVELVSAKFYKEYEKEFYFDPSIKSRQMTYIAEIDGEIKPDTEEIEKFFWVSKEDIRNKKYDVKIEENVINDLINDKIW